MSNPDSINDGQPYRETQLHFPKFTGMKSAFLLVATALSSIVGVIGMPTTSLSSRDATEWICIVESSSISKFGIGQAKTQAKALDNAREECRHRGGGTGCASQVLECVEEGCVAISYGAKGGLGLGFQNSLGANNGPVAASKAKSGCEGVTTACKSAAIFCVK